MTGCVYEAWIYTTMLTLLWLCRAKYQEIPISKRIIRLFPMVSTIVNTNVSPLSIEKFFPGKNDLNRVSNNFQTISLYIKFYVQIILSRVT